MKKNTYPKAYRLAGALAITLLLSACHNTTPNSPQNDSSIDNKLGQQFNKIAETSTFKYFGNQLVVKYQNEASLQAAAHSIDSQVVDRIPEIQVALLRVPSDSLKIGQRIRNKQGILGAWPNAVINGSAPFTRDSQNSEGISIKNLTSPQSFTKQSLNKAAKELQIFDELPQYALDKYHLNAKASWDAGLTGKGVTVAIFDDPADVTHPDLAPNWVGMAYNPQQDKVYTDGAEWAKNSQSRYASHGTFVASAVAAAKDGKGIVGVAPEAKILPVTFNPAKEKTNEFYSDFLTAKGTVWAANQGARVLNNSWGGGYHWGALKDAYDYAMSRGAVVVASMGNSNQDEMSQPANLAGVVASGALDARNVKVIFSTSGRHISSGAPGEKVLLANPTWQWTAKGRGDDSKPEQQNRYELISGTSFSGPYTAGVAALVLQKCPVATPYQVRRVMEMYADSSIGSNPNGWDRDTGWGRLDAGAIAKNLTCDNLPIKGANVKVKVTYFTEKGEQQGEMANITLRSTTAQAGNLTDPSPIYIAATNSSGEAFFSEIKPGEYEIYAAGPNTYETGYLNSDRGTYIGKLTANSGSSYDKPDVHSIAMKSTQINYNPQDPYEPNDGILEAKEIKYGDTTQIAYIFGKPRDVDYFKFNGKAGDTIQADVWASGRLGSKMDAYLFLLASDGTTKLAFNDDRGNPRIDQDSQITYKLPKDGLYYLRVSTCKISCDPKNPEDDNSPFNRYKLQLNKLPNQR